MTIYTRTGDDGTTALFGGGRVLKSDLRVEAYGGLDELSAHLGLLDDKEFFASVQKDLHHIMGYLAGAKIKLEYMTEKVMQFEKMIDALESKLPRLRKFVLPQGTECSVHAHIARAVCRRAERSLVRYMHSQRSLTTNYQLLTSVRYLNRLSDLLFTVARTDNANEKTV
jgi:cob(I)alamin adenosyltransferase